MQAHLQIRAIFTLRGSDQGKRCAPEKQGLIVVMHTLQNIFGRTEKSALKQICLFIFALSFAACVSVSTGPHLDLAGVSKIKTGVTTAAELELWFGKPYERKALSGGGEQINWQYTERGAGGGGIGKQWLFVTTRHDGKVKSIRESWYYGNR